MIYLDYQATTALAPEARDAMLPWLGGPESDGFGNPHSSHRMGRMAAAAIEVAREQVASLFPSGGQVIFTGSATEAINMAMRGTEQVGMIAASAIEHAAVLDTASALGAFHEIAVNEDGIATLDGDLPEDVSLICVMQVNNEIGTVQPIADWADRAKARGALLLCDAVQAAGKMEIVDADMIAISAHKFHGPKGIGALWLRDGISLDPLITGGGQEAGLRSGTLSPALIAGFGAAAKLAKERMEEDAAHITALQARALDLFDGWSVNGSLDRRWQGNLNMRKDGVDVSRLMSDARNVMFSAGSACASGSGRPSHVLRALGLTDAQAKSSIRLGFGRYTSAEELERAAKAIINAASQQG